MSSSLVMPWGSLGGCSGWEGSLHRGGMRVRREETDRYHTFTAKLIMHVMCISTAWGSASMWCLELKKRYVIWVDVRSSECQEWFKTHAFGPRDSWAVRAVKGYKSLKCDRKIFTVIGPDRDQISGPRQQSAYKSSQRGIARDGKSKKQEENQVVLLYIHSNNMSG